MELELLPPDPKRRAAAFSVSPCFCYWFSQSHLLHQGSGVAQFMGPYSLPHLPRIMGVHNPLLHPIPVWQAGEKVEASREPALLPVPQARSEQERCWTNV